MKLNFIDGHAVNLGLRFAYSPKDCDGMLFYVGRQLTGREQLAYLRESSRRRVLLAIAFAARNSAVYFTKWYPAYRRLKYGQPPAGALPKMH